MKPVAIVYATREGQTRKIAEHLGAALRALGQAVEVVDARKAEGFRVEDFRAVVLAASVHRGHHESEMVAFAKAHREALARVPSTFLTVSLSEAGAEDRSRPPEERLRFAADVRSMVETFVEATGWQPARVLPVAGALAYTQYGRVVRLALRGIAYAERASTDTSRDHELTDWEALDRFASDLLAGLPREP